MSEQQPGSPLPIQKDNPVPFFKTIDFTRRPKWETSMTFVNELKRMLGEREEGKEEYLACEMEKIYGKQDAMDVLEHVRRHMNESIARSSYKDTGALKEFQELAFKARGIIGTPDWKDPDKTQEIRISATWDYLKHKK
ncbi:MAG: hypothetical protein V1917_02450 [Candidatus Gottesmanbacteria bacterium]